MLVLVLVLATALSPFAMQIFMPALPSIQTDFGVGAATAQLVFSMSGIAMAVATLFYGPISDATGRRPTMLAGLLIFLLGSLVCALATNIVVLVTGRVIQAAGGVAGMVLSRTIIRDIYTRDEAATAMAYVTMAMVVAPMLAPVLGGFLVEHAAWRSVFAASGVFGVAVLVIVHARLYETCPRPGTASGVLATFYSFRLLLTERQFVAYMAQAAFSLSVFFAFIAAAPYSVITLMEISSTQYGLMFMMVSVSFMAGNYSSALVGAKGSVDGKILFGAIGTAIGTTAGLVLLLIWDWSPWTVFVTMAFTAYFQGIAMPNSQAAVVSVRPEIAGAAAGLAGFVQMVMASLVAQIVGSLQWGTPYPMAVGMFICAIGMMFFSVVAYRSRSHLECGNEATQRVPRGAPFPNDMTARSVGPI